MGFMSSISCHEPPRDKINMLIMGIAEDILNSKNAGLIQGCRAN